MVDDSECIHDLPKYSCTICLHPKIVDPHDDVYYHGTVMAKYDGHCTYCNLPIYEGEFITHDGTRWVHESHL